MPPAAARRHSASADATSPSSARSTPSDVAAWRSPASARLLEPAGGAVPIAPLLEQPAEGERGTPVAVPGGALETCGGVVVAAELPQCDSELAHGCALVRLRRLAQELLRFLELADAARADAELRCGVPIARCGAAAQPALGFLVLAAGVEQEPDARDRLRALLGVLSGAAEPALCLVVPISVVQHARELLGSPIASRLGRRAQHGQGLVFAIVIAQQGRQVHRRDLIAELDASAVNGLGLVVAAQPAQHASEIVRRVHLDALERPPVPALGGVEVRRLGARGRVTKVKGRRRVPRRGRRRRPLRPALTAALAVGERVKAPGGLAIAARGGPLEPRPRTGFVAAPLVHEPHVKGRMRVAALGRRTKMALGSLVVAPQLSPATTPEGPHHAACPEPSPANPRSASHIANRIPHGRAATSGRAAPAGPCERAVRRDQDGSANQCSRVVNR
jgi:hypothetical protein